MAKVWKEKRGNGKRLMICQNSDPQHSKYPNWGPSDGVCKEWVEVAEKTTAVICHNCTVRSLQL